MRSLKILNTFTSQNFAYTVWAYAKHDLLKSELMEAILVRNVEMGRTIEEVFLQALRMVGESSLGFDAGRYDLECAYSGKVVTAETARTPPL